MSYADHRSPRPRYHETFATLLYFTVTNAALLRLLGGVGDLADIVLVGSSVLLFVAVLVTAWQLEGGSWWERWTGALADTSPKGRYARIVQVPATSAVVWWALTT